MSFQMLEQPCWVVEPYDAAPDQPPGEIPPARVLLKLAARRCRATTNAVSAPWASARVGVQCKFTAGHDGDHWGYVSMDTGEVSWPQEPGRSVPAGTPAALRLAAVRDGIAAVARILQDPSLPGDGPGRGAQGRAAAPPGRHRAARRGTAVRRCAGREGPLMPRALPATTAGAARMPMFPGGVPRMLYAEIDPECGCLWVPAGSDQAGKVLMQLKLRVPGCPARTWHRSLAAGERS